MSEDRQSLKSDVYMKMALTISELGTCCRTQVGCILLSESGGVVGAGYNGAGPGMPHCNDEICNSTKRCLRCSHAEENAVTAGISSFEKPYTAYVTHEPCGACTRKLVQAGVRKIFFNKPYTSMPPEEREARQEWLDHYRVSVINWVLL